MLQFAVFTLNILKFYIINNVFLKISRYFIFWINCIPFVKVKKKELTKKKKKEIALYHIINNFTFTMILVTLWIKKFTSLIKKLHWTVNGLQIAANQSSNAFVSFHLERSVRQTEII